MYMPNVVPVTLHQIQHNSGPAGFVSPDQPFPPMQQHMEFNIEEVCDQVQQVSSGPSDLSFEIFGELYAMFVARGQVFKDIERRKMLTDTDFVRLQVLYSTTLAASIGLVDM